MTFKHKLSRRLAMLKDRRAICVAATLAAAVVASCELPARTTDTGTTLAEVVVLPQTVNLVQNQSTDFVAFGVSTASDTMPVAVNWSVTGGNITDSVTSKGMHYGHFKAGAQTGQFKVRAQDPATGMSDSATAVVTAVAVPVASVVVLPAAASAPVGGTVQFVAVPLDATGTALGGRIIVWASSNQAVANVNTSGVATAAATGSTTIAATSEGHSGTATLTVTAVTVPVASVTVSPASASVQAGQAVQLTATPKDASGNPLTGRTVTWTSSNTSVATVNSSGLVSCVVAGSATITATSEGQSGTSAVTVTGAAPGCAASTTAFQNSAFTSQNGSFTATFDATPNGTGLDAATGLSQGAAAAYTDLAVIVRFNTGGTIDARNGGAYAVANTIPYTAGTSYHFRIVVDVPSHTYAAYVTPAGGAEQTIGTGFAFRTEQSTVTALANWALSAITGTHTVCNFAITGSQPPAPVATVTLTPGSA